jgi:hypothetical protein
MPNTTSRKIKEVDFPAWMNFFQGAEVTLGGGSTVWRMVAGHYDTAAKQGRVHLRRRCPNGHHYSYTANAEQLRAYKTSK